MFAFCIPRMIFSVLQISTQRKDTLLPFNSEIHPQS